MNYILCDIDGYELCAGLQDHQAEQIAQRTANERDESVWLYAEDLDNDNPPAQYGQEFRPQRPHRL